ncbi:MAG: hypothetical protein JF922_18280 [Candidatus Dormibacteraeota bacterium]|uniref:Novel STAND NTPase 3 domain-containing protein n=1 Tax=Candidatus Nephthysia bennettiae TaxID=3127016 RepID=A0A934K1T7_9BACT|nr:hypothetical protein [Candidatus Dormibacteraeota bacterium]
MLAQMLAYWYAHRGWQSVFISEDIAEADAVWQAGRAQIFYYDDFLGTIRLNEAALRKNEDDRLASFMRRVHEDDSKRLILTTRDYILVDAQLRYESLAREPFDMYQCLLKIGDYTRLAKARVLYNHLYYSPTLSAEVKRALLANRAYRRVIDHQNYTPRLVSLITALPSAADVEPEGFVSFVLNNVANPSLIWQHAFENQLSTTAQALLVCLATLPPTVELKQLSAAVDAYTRGEGLPLQSFRAALRSLDVTFVSIEAAGGSRHVRIADPSIQDFLLQWLDDNPAAVARILRTTPFFEQCRTVWELTRPIAVDWLNARFPALRLTRRRRSTVLNQPFGILSVDVELILSGMGRTIRAPRLSETTMDSLTARCTQVLEIGRETGTSTAPTIVSEHFDVLVREWASGRYVLGQMVRLSVCIASGGGTYRVNLKAVGQETKDSLLAACERQETVEIYEAVFELANAWPELFGVDEIETYRIACWAYLERTIEDQEGAFKDRDEGIDALQALARCAELAQVDVDDELRALEKHVEELPVFEYERDYGDPFEDDEVDRDGDVVEREVSEDDEIDTLFSMLAE